MKITLFRVLLACIGMGILFLIFGAYAKADERKQFWQDVKDAQFFNGKRFNCCGPADAVRAKVIASNGTVMAVQIVDVMRHPTAKVGEIVSVPVALIVRKPLAPEGMGTILFLSIAAKAPQRVPFCLVQKRAGG